MSRFPKLSMLSGLSCNKALSFPGRHQLQRVLAAGGGGEGEHPAAAWLRDTGEVEPVTPCALLGQAHLGAAKCTV